MPVQTHLHETSAEVDDAIAETGQRPIARLDDLGLVNPGLMAVHATQLTDAEIDLLALNGCSVVHCPRSNLKLASGACPVAGLLAAGVNVALGTDGAASNNRLDLWAEMDTAALLGKFAAGDASALPAPELLKMATINGARALGLEDTVGSLEPGKSADAICVRLDATETRPVHDPVSQLVYAAGREHVTDVWVAGEHLLEGGTLTRMDPAAICARADEWGGQDAGVMSRATPNADPQELARFEALADSWWNPDGPMKALHQINPLRLDYIDRRAPLKGAQVLDVGCGAGLLSEGMARRGARVLGIDLAEASLDVAVDHAREHEIEVEYRCLSAEQVAEERPGAFDIVTCLEMLEHVPDPAQVVAACAPRRATGRHGVLFHHQSQPEKLSAGHSRCRARPRNAAERHPRIRKTDTAIGTGRLVPGRRTAGRGCHRPSLQPPDPRLPAWGQR